MSLREAMSRPRLERARDPFLLRCTESQNYVSEQRGADALGHTGTSNNPSGQGGDSS